MRGPLTHWLILSLLLGTAIYAIAEDITLTTYYPSPRGVYQELKTAGDMVVGNITDAPGARLHVVQDNPASAVPVFRADDETSDTSPFLIDQDGNVGIGTTSPGSKLTVTGTIEANAGGLKFPDSTVQATASPWAASGPNVYNTNTGNVGIGTASPSQKLEVTGRIRIGDDTSPPMAGTIRWTGTDFQGFNGTSWVNFWTSSCNWSGSREIIAAPAPPVGCDPPCVFTPGGSISGYSVTVTCSNGIVTDMTSTPWTVAIGSCSCP